jgi:TadE-like protein
MRSHINYLTRQSKRPRQGIAALEFLFAAPAFFVLVFFVVEIALVWNDRHVMRLAAYRAARTVVKMRADGVSSGTMPLCWGPLTGAAASVTDQNIAKSARRSASKVMATVTPTVSQMIGSIGSAAAGLSDLAQEGVAAGVMTQFGQGIAPLSTAVDTVTSNPYAHAIFRVMNGLPAAWMFTDLECHNVLYPPSTGTAAIQGVEIQLTYHRSAKMPYVGNIMSLVHRISDYYESHSLGSYDGNSGMIKVNPLNYGIDFAFSTSDPVYVTAVTNFTTAIQDTLRVQATDIATTAAQRISENLGGASTAAGLAGSAASAGMDQIFSVVTPLATNAMNNFATSHTATVNAVGAAGLNLFLQFPDMFKTIPIKVSVRIPNYSQAYVNAGKAWDGKAVMLGYFTHDDSNMGKLGKAIGNILDELGTHSDPLPYIH